jgi:Predicted kinase
LKDGVLEPDLKTYKKLSKPINALEKKNDLDMTWRKKVNQELNVDYKKIFNKIDNLIFLRVPNFECVYKWRLTAGKKATIDFQR